MKRCGQVVSIGKNVKKVGVGDWVILGWIKGKGINSKGAIYSIDNQKINSGPVTTFGTYSVVSENRVVKLPKIYQKILLFYLVVHFQQVLEWF